MGIDPDAADVVVLAATSMLESKVLNGFSAKT